MYSYGKRIQLTLAIAVAVGAGVAAQPSADERAVLQAHEQRNKALLMQNVAALEMLLADEMKWVHSSALIESRAQVLERVESGASRWLKVEPHGLEVRVYGTAAIVSGRLDQTTAGPGRPPADRSLLILEVYVRRNGVWQLTNFQATAVPNRG